jgi:hypothetical protein
MWFNIPKDPQEAYLPNLGGVVEQFWSIWIQEHCFWTPPTHWLVDGRGMNFDA